MRSDETGKRPTDYYQITMEKVEVEIIPDQTTKVWSYNGQLPGPLIRQRGGVESFDQGRQSVVRFINQLGQDAEGQDIRTSVHLHGMASNPEYDGYAEDLSYPGYFKDYVYPNDRAATIWYHDHAIAQTSRNVYMGLAGMYIVEDEFERALNLPQGNYDVPLILQDMRLDTKGQLVFGDRGRRSVYGDVVLINGIPWPRMKVERRRYRFRVLNASASRTYQLVLSRKPNGQSMNRDTLHVIATDCGLLGQCVPLSAPFQRLRISPAERYEFIIDFSGYDPGTHLFLRNPVYSHNIDSNADSQVLMRFDVGKGPPKDEGDLPEFYPVKSIFELAREEGIKIGGPRVFRFQHGGNL